MSNKTYKHEMVIVYNALTKDDYVLFSEAVTCKGESHYEIAESLLKRIMDTDGRTEIVQILYAHKTKSTEFAQENAITDEMVLAMADVLDVPVKPKPDIDMVMSPKTFNDYVQALINSKKSG